MNRDEPPQRPPLVAVAADPPTDPAIRRRAESLADELRLPLGEAGADLLLTVTPQQVELRVAAGPAGLRGGRPIAFDLTRIDTRPGAGGRLSQPLVRAVGIRKGEAARPRVLDATAGFGEDAWLLAAMGCEVVAVEREPVVAALLRDAVERAARSRAEVAERVRVVTGESLAVLERIAAGGEPTAGPVDVVYLDPMFPTGRKAQERKPMRVLRWLVGEDGDAGALLEAARRVARRRVVVKRPLRAPAVGDAKPTATHRGRAVRYDVYAAHGGGGSA